LVLYGDGQVGPVEERVPNAEVKLGLVFLCEYRKKIISKIARLHTCDWAES
jgi:hypothetical protein